MEIERERNKSQVRQILNEWEQLMNENSHRREGVKSWHRSPATWNPDGLKKAVAA